MYTGRVISGRLVLQECIGEGGMGWVYAAHHTGLDKRIAVKLLKRTGDPSHAARFVREAQSSSRLDHPNIVSVLDFGEDGEDQLLYIAMEEIIGETLAALLDRGPLAPPKAVDLMLQTLSGLAHAHRAGIVHRDLKPGNIMIVRRPNEDGEVVDFVKVLDFGLVKLLGQDDSQGALTRRGVTVGTPQYMSPEQCVGDELDGRTDVYACGAILFEMLAGRPPFVAESPGGIIMAHLHAPVPSLTELVPEVDSELASIVEWTLEKRVSARCPSAIELRRALGKCATNADDPFDLRTVVDASLFRRAVSESSSIELSTSGYEPTRESLVLSVLESTPGVPSSSSLEMVVEAVKRTADPSELAGVVLASGAAAEVPRSPTEVDRGPPFWVWTQAGELIGPVGYFEASRLVESEIKNRRPDSTYVSADCRTWKSVTDFAQLTQQEGVLSVGPPERLNPELEPTLSIFARITLQPATGSIIIEAGNLWAEIEVVAGAPTHVSSNDPTLQLPHILVDRQFMKREMLMRVMHESLRCEQPMVEVLNSLVDLALLKRAVLREQLARIFGWEDATGYADHERWVTHGSPITTSLLEGVVSLVAFGTPLDRLRKAMAAVWTTELRRTPSHAGLTKALHLLPGEQSIVDALDGTKSPAEVLDGVPGFGKSHIALIYTLVQTHALEV